MMTIAQQLERVGEDRGIKKGFERGFEQGVKQGVKEMKLLIAHKLLLADLALEWIADVTGLSMSQLACLQTLLVGVKSHDNT